MSWAAEPPAPRSRKRHLRLGELRWLRRQLELSGWQTQGGRWAGLRIQVSLLLQWIAFPSGEIRPLRATFRPSTSLLKVTAKLLSRKLSATAVPLHSWFTDVTNMNCPP